MAPILREVTIRPVPHSAVLAVCALLTGTALALTWQGLALAGDGSFYLVRVLGTESVFGPDFRVFANVVRQAPVLIGIAGGVTDTHLLTLLHGVGQLLLPAIAWSLAVALSRADRVVFAAVAMTAGLCMGTTWFFSVSESVLAAPLTVLVAVLLWQPRSWHLGSAGLASAAALILVATYETALLTGVVLAAWAAWRATRATVRLERYGCALVSALSLLSVLVAVAGSRAGANPTSSRSFLYFVASLEPWTFYLGLVGIIAVTVALGSWLRGNARGVTLGLGCGALIAAVVGLEVDTVTAFQARGGAVAAAFLLEVFLCWCWIRGRGSIAEAGDESPARWLVAVPVAFVASMVVVNVQPVSSWSHSLDAFRAEVDRTNGVVRADEVLPPGRLDVLWDWSAASLSLIVRADRDSGVLVDRDPSFVPFPPAEARAQIDDEYTWGG